MDTRQSLAFGTLLRRHRIAAGLTQQELAERAQVSRRSIGGMERGVRHKPRKDTLALLAAALALSSHDRSALVDAARRLGTTLPLTGAPTATAESPFVGRARELALLDRHLAGEGPPLLLLAGEPGIGKTRLLRAAIARGAGCGLRVLEGGCQRHGGQEPYAPVLEALQRGIRGQPPARLRVDLQGCAWLVRLLPELADGPIPPLPAWTLAPEQERRLMGEAVARFLTNAAGPAGTLLVLDDLQWAGPDGLALLATLTRAAGEIPLRVLGAYRDTEVPPEAALSATLTDLAHAGMAARRLLGPLAPEEAAQLLDSLLEDVDPHGWEGRTALRERALLRAGGVPFFVVSGAQALHQDASDDHSGNAVPWDVRQSVRQRVVSLPEAVRDLLSTAAVLGRVAEPGVLTAAAAQAEGDVLSALDIASRARLLVEEHGTYQFAHDVIREVIEADLGAARRAVLHGRVARALEHQTGVLPIDALAYHFARSGDQEKAIVYLGQAGDAAQQRYAHAAAEDSYRQLVDRLDQRGRALDAARIRENLGNVLVTTARYDAALETLERVAQVYRMAGDLESEGRVTAQIGWAHAQRGTPMEGMARIQLLVDPLEACGPSHGLVTLYIALARLAVLTAHPREELAAGTRAVALARVLGNTRLLAAAAGRCGLALLHTSQWDEGFRMLEEASTLAEEVGDVFTLCRALANAAESGHIPRGEFGAASQCLDRAREAAERLGDPTQIASILCMRGRSAFLIGEWSQARADLERGLTISRQVGVSWVLADTLRTLGELHLSAGEWDEAARYLQEFLAIGESNNHPRAVVDAGGLLAERDLLRGHAAEAATRLRQLLGREGGCADWILMRLAWAHLELGDAVQATEPAAEAVAQFRARNDRPGLVDALRVQALAAIRVQSWADAENSLREGLLHARSLPYPYAEARLLHVYGLLQAAQGESEQARERLEAALAIFQRLGARKDIERVEQVVATLSQN